MEWIKRTFKKQRKTGHKSKLRIRIKKAKGLASGIMCLKDYEN